MQGFVNDRDWTGKTMAPFNSHEGSGDGGTTVKKMRRPCL